MEQYIDIAMQLPIALFLVWFIITCINTKCRKKWLYIAEIVTLVINIICDICLAVFPETLETRLIQIAWAAICGWLVFSLLSDFYKYC